MLLIFLWTELDIAVTFRALEWEGDRMNYMSMFIREAWQSRQEITLLLCLYISCTLLFLVSLRAVSFGFCVVSFAWLTGCILCLKGYSDCLWWLHLWYSLYTKANELLCLMILVYLFVRKRRRRRSLVCEEESQKKFFIWFLGFDETAQHASLVLSLFSVCL